MSAPGLKRVRGVTVFRPIVYGNSCVLLTEQERNGTDHTHRWTVGVRSAASAPYPNQHPNQQIGGADDISYMIKKVTFKLYETYKNPLRCESDSGRKAGRLVPPGKLTATPLLPVTAIEQPPFEVTETGWGEFDIIIKVFFAPESNEKPLTFTHHLKLHPWPVDPILYAQPTATGEPSIPTPSDPAAAATPLAPPVLSPVHSWQYEELCFTEPTEAFYAVLLEHKPTPLPKSNRHPKLLTHPLSAGGNIGEFSLEMEDDEGRRIDKAREKTLEQIEDLRRQLVSYDQELGSLKKEVEEIQKQKAAEGTGTPAAAQASPAL
ncbi:hypothetical protein BMF94_3034 [Rhodotorula taiwanensis]|uniref:Protein AF-9 homolog n=1 Tax=Rhodotorula taiwanensis TaxID=741276 RepID=A0A2S5BAS2_9BASI|nr:hypothetical protein BMF94_3034 [Rhodotorula taiwanensis]